jgi:hypothetical protein
MIGSFLSTARPSSLARLIAELRAKSGDRLLRLIAVRSFLALTNHPQKLSTTILAQHENAPCQHNSNPFN